MSLFLAFLPAVVVGLLAHGFVKEVLFETPMLIAVMLILGGFVLLFVDRLGTQPLYHTPEEMPLRVALGVGLFQCLALVPGVSRSGATIVGGLLLRADKRTAAEFSFFLSMPTMAGAVAYDLWKSRDVLDFSALTDIAVGFAAAFIAAALVVRWLLNFVSRRGYAFFGWWRIIVGGAALVALLAGF
jgi:undecaprenyl-diphosphatase